MEVWKDIEGYEGLYQVSDEGRVKKLLQGNKGTFIVKPTTNYCGYLKINLRKNGTQLTYYVHRLVAGAFVDNPYNYNIINHKDENKLNNKASNLEWCTQLYNNTYNGLPKRRGISRTGKGMKPIVQYTLDGKFIRKWNGAFDVEKELGLRSSVIVGCLKGRTKTAYKYIWKYET